MIEVTNETFEQEVMESEGPVVVYFSATWCGPCKAMKPVLERLEEEYKDKAKFVKVDVDAVPDLAAEFNVRGIPTLSLVKYGTEIDTSIGAKSQAQLSAWLMTNV